jgi:hypothetical protein
VTTEVQFDQSEQTPPPPPEMPAIDADVPPVATAAPEPAPQMMVSDFCVKCGAKMEPQKAFCTTCGNPRTIVGMQMPISAKTERRAKTAMALEIFLGFIGFLGIGHMYSGRILVGVIWLFVWLFVRQAFIIGTLATAGLLGIVALVLAIGVPIYSGMKVLDYVRSQGD